MSAKLVVLNYTVKEIVVIIANNFGKNYHCIIINQQIL